MRSAERKGNYFSNSTGHYYDPKSHVFVPMNSVYGVAFETAHNAVLQEITGVNTPYRRLTPLILGEDLDHDEAVEKVAAELVPFLEPDMSARLGGWMKKMFKPTKGVDMLGAVSVQRLRVPGLNTDQIRESTRQGMYALLSSEQFEGLLPAALVEQIHLSEAIMNWTTRLEFTAQNTPDDLAA